MIVTINTDASFHPHHEVGAYAFWIVCNEAKVLKYGALKSCKNSLDAEIMCIANALTALNNTEINFQFVHKVVINTDCTDAIQGIENKGKYKNKSKNLDSRIVAQEVMKKIRKKSSHLGFDFRHVPAHRGTTTPRAWVNEWCDIHAKKALWEMINSKK